MEINPYFNIYQPSPLNTDSDHQAISDYSVISSGSGFAFSLNIDCSDPDGVWKDLTSNAYGYSYTIQILSDTK